jgi:hypothetical protein
MTATYPRIDTPDRQPDGSFIVRVHKKPGVVEGVPAKDRKAANDLHRFLERAMHLFADALEPPKKRPSGRKLQLNDEVIARVVQGYEHGMLQREVAWGAGVHPGTLCRWLQEGEDAYNVLQAEGEQYQEPEDKRLMRELYEQVHAATARLQDVLISSMISSSASDWRAAEALLKRKWREFADRQDIDLNVGGDALQRDARARLQARIAPHLIRK